MDLLDPWDDAQRIADRLRLPDGTLHVFIGMESSCIKCAILRQVWNEYVTALPADDNQVWMWLDTDEHGEFLGDYIPNDPPVYIRYKNGTRTVIASLKGFSSGQLEIQAQDEAQSIPDFYVALTNDNWSE